MNVLLVAVGAVDMTLAALLVVAIAHKVGLLADVPTHVVNG
jgi:hypothetical protein